MIVWVDAQLSPALAPWIQQQFVLAAVSVRALGLRDSKDREIFEAAKAASAIVLTKDSRHVTRAFWSSIQSHLDTVRKHVESRSEAAMLPKAIRLLEGGEHLVEITEPL